MAKVGRGRSKKGGSVPLDEWGSVLAPSAPPRWREVRDETGRVLGYVTAGPDGCRSGLARAVRAVGFELVDEEDSTP
jgi:hypothetical protein